MARTHQSRSATPQGLELANAALQKVSQGKKTVLAGFTGVSRSTVSKFFNGKPISLENFQAICQELKLDWMVVAGLSEATETKTNIADANQPDEINDLVQKTRQQIQPYIQEGCGTMRVLDMTQPIELGKIYTNVNILEKITGRTWREIAQLQEKVSRENFERWCRGTVTEERIPGIEAAEKFSKLMILGKPGAGKTTFLKHLAIQCIGGAFQAERVPVFITLKDFADIKEHPNLLEYLQNLLKSYSDEMEDISTLSSLLKAGKFLILLDGLDEVREIDSSRILTEIKDISQQFPQNQFVITCRIAAKEYTFEKFTEVEVADFNEEQIADFSHKWFHSKNDPVKAEGFLEKLKQDESIMELATNPLLLTLLCLVFEDVGSFPSNRTRLYAEGIAKLLREWNISCERERDPVYKKLSPDYREELLCIIPWNTFQRGNYFFYQEELAKLIRDYIQNLPGITQEDLLKLDHRAVLDSIELQHGLLVERARGIYSFSHLTFHEYFTARKIVISCNQQYDHNYSMLKNLIGNFNQENWREVFLLTTAMLDSAEILVQEFKNVIDQVLSKDQELQNLLKWVYQQTKPLETSYKASAMRAFYLAFTQNLEKNLETHLCFKIDPLFDDEFKSLYDQVYGFFSRPNYLTLEFVFILLANKFTGGYFNLPISKIKLPNGDYEPEPEADNFWSRCYGPLPNNCYLSFSIHKILPPAIYYIAKDSPETLWIWQYLDDWWAMNNPAWTEQLIDLIEKYRNLGFNQKINKNKKQLLLSYYNACKLLFECLNSDCYVSREVRQEIEETLLLPIEEIEKWKQNRQLNDRG
ncbi:NACHT C-terminal helical domain 2-containing protein [Capilliphycus salinus ALCB114379]|uniref:NACHT C-terminal helical domain 2-containing protein n=1 Tax=Capilliphycus salinus TaxID=2768948 RepID=UPI0039A7600F